MGLTGFSVIISSCNYTPTNKWRPIDWDRYNLVCKSSSCGCPEVQHFSGLQILCQKETPLAWAATYIFEMRERFGSCKGNIIFGSKICFCCPILGNCRVHINITLRCVTFRPRELKKKCTLMLTVSQPSHRHK